ncbi:MAG: glycosyl hydrolase 115 family protein, partial [Fermentimonas sp.]|nr:glycosyl hydrolase 115 family protein [Fermentimonas sp.]
MNKNYWTTVCFIFLSTIFIQAQDIVFPKGAAIHYEIEKNASQVVHTALSIFEGDLNRVLNASLNKSNKKGSGKLIIHTLNSKDHNDNIASKHEAFRVEVKDGNLYVTGADANGTAYGIMELSRMLGVSPWEWWADSAPSLKDKWIIPSGFFSEQSPAVLYRGIFLNDEDWGLLPWSYKNYEPSDIKGRIGPKTYKAIFELMLRLRANILWPAMHEVTIPFYFVEGNREMADRYGITIGTSHCEPLQRSTPVEWPAAGVGDYDYVNNSDNVYKFWEERVKEVSGSNNYFTIGMRGVHDGKMQGAQTIEEQRAVLERVFKDQRALIAKYIDSDVASVPQVFIPYKEVLDIYRSGLEVPDDVTLMWCDDNYGYMRSLPNKQEQLRSGGNGLYYHISYWGRPHDYLWLASTSPSLIRK